MSRKSQRNRKRHQMQVPLLRAARQYRFKARRARRAGATPLTDTEAVAAASELLRAAARWHQEWLAWRILVERPPQLPSEPLPPPKTLYGTLIRAAKSLGYARYTGGPEQTALARALLDAAESLPYRLQAAESPGPVLAECLARADHPEPVEG